MDRSAPSNAPPHCIGIGHLVAPPTWAAKRHQHDFVEVMAILGGTILEEMGGHTMTATTGDVLFYPVGVPHQEWARGGRRVELTFLGYRGGSFTAPPLSRDATGKIRVLFQWLREEQSSSYSGKAGVMDAILATILAEIRRAALCPDDPLIGRMRDYMREHLAEAVEVEELARVAGMSRAHFIRRYKAASGHTPMADLRRLRVEAARDRLITTKLPLKAIALATGFCDEFHLSRVFRKQLQAPPGYFRKS